VVNDSRWETPDGSAPFSEGESQPAQRKAPEVPGFRLRKGAEKKRTRGRKEAKGKAFFWLSGGRTRKARNPKRAYRLRPELNPPGAKGARLLDGRKPLEPRAEVVVVLAKRVRAERRKGDLFSTI
jgi:hypothetical protein